MRGAPGNASVSLRWNTPHPSRRGAPIHLLPQGEKERARVMQRAFVILGLDPRIHAVTIPVGRNGAEF